MFSSNGYVSSKWGFDRGWDVNRNFIRESLPNGSDYLWKTAKAWLTPIAGEAAVRLPGDHRAARRLHAAKEFLVKYWDKPYIGPIKPALSGVQLGLIKSGKLKINDNDKKYLEALHDGEITAERRRVRDVHRRPEDDGHLREIGGDRRLRPRRPVLRARQRRPRRHRLSGAGARAA